MVALYIAPESRRLRRLVIELHTSASRNLRVARVLRKFSERMAMDTRTRIEAGRENGMLESGCDPGLSARLLMVLIAGLAYGDTLYPGLLGDLEWKQHVMESVALLIGIGPRKISARSRA